MNEIDNVSNESCSPNSIFKLQNKFKDDKVDSGP